MLGVEVCVIKPPGSLRASRSDEASAGASSFSCERILPGSCVAPLCSCAGGVHGLLQPAKPAVRGKPAEGSSWSSFEVAEAEEGREAR